MLFQKWLDGAYKGLIHLRVIHGTAFGRGLAEAFIRQDKGYRGSAFVQAPGQDAGQLYCLFPVNFGVDDT